MHAPALVEGKAQVVLDVFKEATDAFEKNLLRAFEKNLD